jgi:meso-butanediol dehydrogenase/(S,S)-butanediol dehydrogenase/diacetyl reductase
MRDHIGDNMGNLDGKVVVITGAAGGIGSATADVVYEQGGVVVPAGRDDSELAAIAAVRDDPRWNPITMDVTDEASVNGGFADLVARFGRLDGLVNNAGVLIPNEVPASTVAEFDAIFGVNVRGTYLCCRAALPFMIEQRAGSIVNIGSINSIGAEKKLALYVASKGAILMLTKAIALDHAHQGVRANVVCPGFVDTPLNVPHYELLGGRDELERSLADFQPIGRPIGTREIAEPIAFLLSDGASAMTGSAMIVDGGVLAKA